MRRAETEEKEGHREKRKGEEKDQAIPPLVSTQLSRGMEAPRPSKGSPQHGRPHHSKHGKGQSNKHFWCIYFY